MLYLIMLVSPDRKKCEQLSVVLDSFLGSFLRILDFDLLRRRLLVSVFVVIVVVFFFLDLSSTAYFAHSRHGLVRLRCLLFAFRSAGVSILTSRLVLEGSTDTLKAIAAGGVVINYGASRCFTVRLTLGEGWQSQEKLRRQH